MALFENFRRRRQARALRLGEDLLELRGEGVLPPARPTAGSYVGQREALGLGSVYRAVDLLTTSLGQLGVQVTQYGQRVNDDARPLVVRSPSLTVDRRTFVEQTVMSLALRGDFFWLRREFAGQASLEVLPPDEVTVQLLDNGHREYSWRGKKYDEYSIVQRSFIMMPGQARGLGPIQAAREDLRSALDLRGMTSEYFDGTGQPAGILSSEQVITHEDAVAAKQTWNAADTDNPSRIKVLGKGLDYKPILISPRDAMWIEARNLSKVEIATLFGVPAGMLLVTVEGNSQTYQNVEQEWIAWSRFTLAKYLGKIEDAWSQVAGAGVEVRFNVDALLRSDTKTRYDAHAVALDKGWTTVDEVRALEHMPPLTDAQRAELRAANAKVSEARELAELVQKIYLGVGTVLTADEARTILTSAGAKLTGPLPAPAPALAPIAGVPNDQHA